MLRSLFGAHDVPVTIGGEQHAAMMGGLGSFISLDIWVAAEHADRARELLLEIQSAPATSAADDDDDHDDDCSDIALRLERRKRTGVAIALALVVTLGTAHLSVGALKRAIALAAIEIFGFYELAAVGAWPGVVLVAGAILYDAIGAVMILNKRFAQRIPPARLRA